MSRGVVMPDTGNGNRPTCSDNSNKGREFERVLPGRPLARPAEGTPRLLRPSRLMSVRTSSVSLPQPNCSDNRDHLRPACSMRARNWPSWWLGAQDYLNSVMRKSPPTPKPILDPGVLVIAIAIPPSKANTPTTAIVDRLTLPRKRLDRS